MAKSDNNADSAASATGKVAKDKPKKKKSGCLIPILLFIVVIGGLTTVIALNLFGVKDSLANMVSDVPVLNNLFPVTSEEGVDDTQPVTRRVSREYEAQIAELMAQIESLNESLEQSNEKSDLYVAEIDRLRDFENQQVQFRQDKDEFDRMIAENDLNAYAKFYKQISPENAANLYREAIVTEIQNIELNNYVSTVTAMDEAAAARMLEQMIPSDMDLVVLILRNIDTETRGNILGAMSVTNAASVYKQLAPE